ncbi:heme lyase CcmF/NrfE family subunit [Legionella israelensis]|uniref:Heme lyase CcmF/NrfE family subunit n=1 Tax=Legionella israelensis TaxID=454 RepID=A0AAX1EGD5_9GAMM|nr:heme lyase CcmF/NrfE family subunit [Legionella israelensis]QBR83874.1 heme lyase CcmF/NrfE family subunit [Legionella israelensis]
MVAEVGLFSLILALMFAVLLVSVPLIGLHRGKADWINASSLYVIGLFFFTGLAYCSLTFCFLTDDFSLNYVLANSSISLPWFYKLCAVWGGHEGSMLLWVVILSFWILLANFCSFSLDIAIRIRVLVVLGWLSIGFLLFLLLTSNPFLRQFVTLNAQGRDLNPLLQDPGFLFHPPMLYMGYVGFSIAFAFAIAALWTGKIEASWAKWTRPWTLAAWCCLTAGITLGSWWAYRELGWGGWWFWDPVENASFMPWLTGTALIHSLAVTEQRQQFKAWTMLLAIAAFSLSLIGTFLVRSGVLTSVHAFAVDPQRGLFILAFLLVVIGGSLLLFTLRAQSLQTVEKPAFVSRESALLLNNVFLVVMMLTILMGTVYPLVVDGLGLGKLSVGAPYFNAVFVPLMVPMLLVMGLGVNLRWKKDRLQRLAVELNWVAFFSLLIPVMLLWLTSASFNSSVLLGLILAAWIVLTTLKAVYSRIQQRGGLSSISQAYWGMVIAHCGVAVTVIGIAVSTGYGVQQDVVIAPGGDVQLQDYTLKFEQQKELIGPNYTGTEVVFRVNYKNRYKWIYPQKRIYTVGQMPMTESAIDVNPFRDIYVALGEPVGEESWSVRIYYKPFVRWIWGGGFLILAGGFLAFADRRYFIQRSVKGGNYQEVEA